MINTENKDTADIPVVSSPTNNLSHKNIIKSKEGYSLTVSSHSSTRTYKVRTVFMSEMEAEYNNKTEKLMSITFKDTSVNKEVKLLNSGIGIISVVDGVDTFGENSQFIKKREENITSITINGEHEYEFPFNTHGIYRDITSNIKPDSTSPNTSLEETQDFWWSGFSIEEVNKAVGLDMNIDTFKKVMMKMHDLFEKEEKSAVIKALDVELKETIEVVYIPNEKDLHGEWMSKDTIIKGESNFSDNLKAGLVKGNLFHHIATDKFTIEDSWVTKIDGSYGEDNTFIPEGTWLAKCKFHDDTLWDMKKSGELGGLSFGGRAFVDETTGEITGLTFDPLKDTNKVEAIFDNSEG